MAKTIYKKKIKNGKEYYFYRLRHENLRKPKDIYAASVAELKEKIKKSTTELDHNIINNKDCFENFLFDWLFDVCLINLKPSTKERYYSTYKLYVKNSPISDIPVKDLKARDLQTYYAKLIKAGKSIHCVKTLNKLIGGAIRYAYSNDMIIKDFSRSVVLPKEDKRKSKFDRVKPFTMDEQIKFLNYIKNHSLEMLFIAALNTGMRQGELLALTWNDINFNDGCIDVNKNVKFIMEVDRDGTSKGKLIVQIPKTVNSIRKVDVPPFLVEMLKHHKIAQNENRLKLANKYENNNLVFCNKYGKYLTSGTTNVKFKEILKNMNLQDRCFHDLRHTYATRLFELGENPKTVSELLGHANVSTTLDIYTHVLDSMKEKAISKLNDLYLTMGTN
ncbi:tyrosine-type recombinase/integrase [Clostridium beijerinckii]|uniref:Site-specific integrase n=1 Tax=Clostridium beijerinckii TaxID=1520 RepID=A0A1S9N301_CLOBE|nr:site-specific integrase [Clostridium beijerinckii]OOP71733.1 site-specific integrase [Clostridium beijerinckii]